MTSQKQSNGNALWGVYTLNSKSFSILVIGGTWLFRIYIIVGFSVLLVLSGRVIPGPLEREASDRNWLHVFFVYVRMILIYQFVHRGSQVTLYSFYDYGKNLWL